MKVIVSNDDDKNQIKFQITYRYGASSYPRDGGTPPVISILDKLIELRGTHHQSQLNTCLKIILKTMPQIEMPYKVRYLLLCAQYYGMHG